MQLNNVIIPVIGIKTAVPVFVPAMCARGKHTANIAGKGRTQCPVFNSCYYTLQFRFHFFQLMIQTVLDNYFVCVSIFYLIVLAAIPQRAPDSAALIGHLQHQWIQGCSGCWMLCFDWMSFFFQPNKQAKIFIYFYP